MYSREKRKKAIELYIKYDKCAADVNHELETMIICLSVFSECNNSSTKSALLESRFPRVIAGLLQLVRHEKSHHQGRCF